MTDDSPLCLENLQRLRELTEDLAKQDGIMLTSVSLDHDRPESSSCYHLLVLSAGDCSVTEKLHYEELVNIRENIGNSLTETKLRSAVGRLRILLGT